MSCNLHEHEPVATRREMIVSENEEMFIPILVGISGGEEDRKQVYERLATPLTELAPQGNLPTVTIPLRKLLRPRVYDDRQGNIPSRQQFGQSPHVLQGSRDTTLNSKRLITTAGVEARNRPADAGVIGIDRPSPVAEKGLNGLLEVNTHPVGHHEVIYKKISLLRRCRRRLCGALRRGAMALVFWIVVDAEIGSRFVCHIRRIGKQYDFVDCNPLSSGYLIFL